MEEKQQDDAESLVDSSTIKPKVNRLAHISVIFGLIPFAIYIALIFINIIFRLSDLLMTCLFYSLPVFFIVGSETGLIGLRQIRKLQERGKGHCITGICLAIWWLIVFLLGITFQLMAHALERA